MLYIVDPYIIFFLFLFIFSFVCFFNNEKNPFIVLVMLELQLILSCMLLAYFSYINQSVLGFVLLLFFVAFAGAEASAGISILIMFYRSRGLFSVETPTVLMRI